MQRILEWFALVLVYCLYVIPTIAQQPRQAAPKAANPQSDEDRWNPRVVVGIRKIPQIKLRPRPAMAAEEASEIKRLIASMVNVDSLTFCVYVRNPEDRGLAFVPLGGEIQAKASPELKKLVELGPQSLPLLLAALDDRTPTKLTVTDNGKWFANELSLSANPNNPIESKVLPPRREVLPALEHPEHTDVYNVTVGDMCFEAIGQIIGRQYDPVRYQPTFSYVINSPTHDPEICRQVRKIWFGVDPRQKLFESLLIDYATEVVARGKEVRGFDVASGLQCHAARRLLYYFPQETAAMVAERIDGFKLSVPHPASGFDSEPGYYAWWMEQLANGVVLRDFVKAVAWSRAPKIEQSLLRFVERSQDIDAVLSALSYIAAKHSDVVRRSVIRLLDDLPGNINGPFGGAYHLLIALGEYGVEADKTVFARFRDRKTVISRRALCHALREIHRGWTIDLLGPLLSDKRKTETAFRICDEAAETISKASPDLKFQTDGSGEDFDHQIEAMRRQITAWKK